MGYHGEQHGQAWVELNRQGMHSSRSKQWTSWSAGMDTER